MLNDNPKPPEVLATWNYQPDLWRDFLQYESGIYKGSVRKAKHLFFGSLILTFVFFLIVFLTLLFPNNWVSDFFELAIALVICGWIGFR